MPKFRTLDDIDVRGKRVLLRADLNVPVKAGVVTDATRIERLAPTIEALIGKGARVVVMSHFGRPKAGPDPALSLRPLIGPLEKAIGGRKVVFASDCIGQEAKRVVEALQPGQVALLENLRFHEGEEANSSDFARAHRRVGGLVAGRRRQTDGGRAEGPNRRSRKPDAAGAGYYRGRQGVDKARPLAFFDLQGRPHGDRRGNG